MVSVRFLYIASVWRPEKLKKVQFKPPWIKLSKDLIHVVQLRMLLLVYDHPVKESHVRAPSRDRLQSLLCVPDLEEIFRSLVPLGLRLVRARIMDGVLRERVVENRLLLVHFVQR